MTFFLKPRDLPGCTLLAFPPEIDLSNADLILVDTLDVVDARRGRLRLLVLDLTGTDFMDSQGVRVVADVHDCLPDPAELRVATRSDASGEPRPGADEPAPGHPGVRQPDGGDRVLGGDDGIPGLGAMES